MTIELDRKAKNPIFVAALCVRRSVVIEPPLEQDPNFWDLRRPQVTLICPMKGNERDDQSQETSRIRRREDG